MHTYIRTDHCNNYIIHFSCAMFIHLSTCYHTLLPCILLQVKDLQDSVSFYLDSSQEPDFLEDETMYDDLQIDDVSAVGLPHANTMHEEDGPLSPAGKLATTPLKSTSQELFDERRRGRMDSTSSDVRTPAQHSLLFPILDPVVFDMEYCT